MSSLRSAAIAALCILFCGSMPALAAEQVGEAVLIKTAVTGQNGPLAVKGPVHRDERIRTSDSGLGQFVFRDGTKLAVGWGSSVVIDKFVFDDSKSVKKLTIRAAKGTFRWISGDSKSSAYEILTPAGTIGVRGTAFDFYVGPDGTTAVVLLSGSARFCGANGCKQLQRRCDCVIATPARGATDPRRVDPGILKTLRNRRALSFLSGTQRLSGGFGTLGAGCGLSMASLDEPSRSTTRRSAAPSRETDKPDTPDKPDNPGKPDKPDKPSKPDKPDKPGKPDTPGKPGKPDKPDNPGKPDKPDKPSKPDKPDKPDKPGKPDTPDQPDTDRHHPDKGKGHDKGKGRGHHEKGGDKGHHDNGKRHGKNG
jgi:hypothetical protein